VPGTPHDDWTRDGVFHGSVTVFQPRDGYRFSVDSVLLGEFASSGRARRAVDLGAGSGVIGFILLHRGGAREVVGVERDPVLAACARRGASENGWDRIYTLLQEDLRYREWRDERGSADLVVSNPPYFRADTGRTSPDPGRARARHETTCTLEDVIAAAADLLRPKGRLCLVVPPTRLEEAVGLSASRDLRLSRLRPVLPGSSKDARMVLLEARLAGSPEGCHVEPPLVMHDETGDYTSEAASILSGGGGSRSGPVHGTNAVDGGDLTDDVVG